MPQRAGRRIDASLRNPSNWAIRDYKELPLLGMQCKPLQPREKADLKVISLDVYALEKIRAVAHIRKPTLADSLLKITACRKEPLPQRLMKHLNVPPCFSRVEQALGRRF